ncbi:MAG: single-stranded DNA-binding protein [Ginsengibacter sp.]|jgi:single-strand DNA-binding protein
MIKLQVIGNLGKDCTVNEVNGKSVINFNVAHSERFKDAQGTQVEKTTWVNCSYWTDRTAVAPYLKKGQLVFAEGTPEVETYTNKDGQQATNLRLRVFSIQLLGGKTDDNQGDSSDQQQSHQSSGSQSSGASTSHAQTPSQVSEPADDLPF